MTIATRPEAGMSVSALAAHFGSLSAFAPAVVQAMQKDESLYSQALREDGLLPGTLVATNGGWKPVEAIVPGELVLTFDNGLRPVTRVHRMVIPRDKVPAHKAFTMVVPTGALGNRRELRLLPCQEVIVESDLAEADFGEPFVMIQALLLERYKGIHRAPIEGDLTIYMLTFDAEEVLHISGAALVTARSESDFSPLTVAALAETHTYLRLTLSQLRRIADSLKRETVLAARA
jgi:hypothetical protein